MLVRPRYRSGMRASLFGVLSLATVVTGCSKSSTSSPPPRASEVPIGAGVDDDSSEDSNETGNEGDDDGRGFDTHVASRAIPAPGHAGRSLYEEVNRELASMRSSTYSHHTEVSETDGRYDLDCSGLVDYALIRSSPQAFEDLRIATVKRPLAKHFVAFITSIPRGGSKGRWHSLSRALELGPGDVLAWLKPADVETKNTGHVMIVRGPAQRDAKRDDMIVVPIADSTAVPHGKSDSRKAARATGLGTGEVLLIVDPAGVPIAYRWSRGKKAREHSTTIAMGRIE